MSATDHHPPSETTSGPTQQKNPFPSAGVARLSFTEADPVNIVTPAIQQAYGYVDNFINRSEEETQIKGGLGNVIAIVGEYGTGKTHLALQLLRRFLDSDSELQALYLDAPADTFLALYRERFFPKLSKPDVKLRVGEYYADIVVDELARSQLTSSLATDIQLRKLSVDRVVRDLGLMQSDFYQTLRFKLRAVTEIEQFGTALTLLLRPELEDAVWEWLSGKAPDQVLIERGISKPIDSDQEALEAMGVIALLYGRQGHNFVVVIDELEKVLSPTGSSITEQASILAFKKLLEVFGSTHAFLILSGLPDFLEALPEDAQARIGCLIRPGALTEQDTRQYIESIQERACGEARLKPFNSDAIRYLVELADGNARKIVRLSYHAYQSAVAAGTDVTRAMLRNVAREQFELVQTEDVRSEVMRALDAKGWRYTENWRLGDKKPIRCDYWIPITDDAAGCVVLISSSILDERSAKMLQTIAGSISELSPVPLKTMLIVNGYLSEHLRESLSNFDQILAYERRDFAENLVSKLSGLRIQLESAVDENILAVIRERVDELSRQNSTLRSAIGELISVSGDQKFYERAVENGIREVFGQFASSRERTARYPELDWILRDVESILTLLLWPMNAPIKSAFDVSNRKPGNDYDRSPLWPNQMFEDRMQRGIGVASIVNANFFAFKKGIVELLDSTRIDSVDRSIVRYLCGQFDHVAAAAGEDATFRYWVSAVFELRSTVGEHSARPKALRHDDSSPERFFDELGAVGRRVYDYVRARERDGLEEPWRWKM